MQNHNDPQGRTRNVRLRPYQLEAIRRIKVCFGSGVRRVLVVAATGSGKTTIAAQFIYEVVGANKRVLFMAHRRELIRQAYDRFLSFGLDESQVGIIMANDRRLRPNAMVQVASIDTLRNRDKPQAKLVIIDEAHRAMASTYRNIIAHYRNSYYIGMTATPFRADEQGLGNIYEELIEVASPQKLIDQGYLVEPKVFTVPDSQLPDLSSVRVRKGDYVESDLAEAVDRQYLVGNLVEHWLSHAKNSRTIAFGVNIAHSQHIAERFCQAGIKAEHIDGTTPHTLRDAVFGRLLSGETKVVSNVNVFSEGVDLPPVKCAILARPTFSTGLYLQQAGRILRPYKGQQAIILDHAGCALEHGLPQEDRDYVLDTNEGAPKKHKPSLKPAKPCPLCFAVLPKNIRICPNCGHVFGDLLVPQEKTGTLIELRADDISVRRKFWYQLNQEANTLGYRPGWAYHRYKDRYGTYPPKSFAFKKASRPSAMDVIRKALKEVIDNAQKLPLLLIYNVPENTASTDLDKALEPVLEVISRANPLEAQAYQDILVERFGVKRRPLAQKLKDVKRKVFWLADKQKKPNERPKITVNGRQLRDVILDSKRVIVDENDRKIPIAVHQPPRKDEVPILFVRMGVLSRLKFKKDRVPELVTMSDVGVYGALVREADWYKVNDEGALVDTKPPSEVARDFIEYPPHQIPEVDAIIATPIFGEDGTLIQAPGLHRKEQIWLQLDKDLQLPEIPKKPTPAQIAEAKAMFLDEMFVDFPLVGKGSWAHLMAATLQPFIRRMIKGRTPLHLIDAPSAGSGKGLLCKLISVVATGKLCDSCTLPKYDDDIRKLLTAELCRARPIILLDNADEKIKYINSPSLASVLTAEVWTDRILGQSTMTDLTNQALWFLTGNNPNFSMELARRIVRIRIDPKRDQAWLRTEFKYNPVIKWAQKHRNELVYAALTLCQSWIAEGCPEGTKNLGSFEHWAMVMDGLLQVIGVEGFLCDLNSLYEQADAEGEVWREFVSAWWNSFGPEEKTITELNDFCEENELMATIRGDRSPQSQKIRLGKALKSTSDRVFGEFRITLSRERGKHNGRSYSLKPIHPEKMEIPTNNPVFENQNDQEEIDPWK